MQLLFEVHRGSFHLLFDSVKYMIASIDENSYDTMDEVKEIIPHQLTATTVKK